MANEEITQDDLIREYFINNPNRDIPHPEVVPWLMEEYQKRTGKAFRDPDRGIRKLSQIHFLGKIKKGVYRYEPEAVKEEEWEGFPLRVKEDIFKNDGYKCVICGKGRKDGVELHADHIIPRDKRGKSVLENGQTLCSQHNFIKKNLNQTEVGKKFFLHMLDVAITTRNKELIQFCGDILAVYEKHQMDTHIQYNPKFRL